METKERIDGLSLVSLQATLRWLLAYTPPWVVDPGDYGITPAVRERLVIGHTVAASLGDLAFPNPDGDDDDVDGPGGPVMRDALIGLSVARLAGAISDRDIATRLQASALEGVARQVDAMRATIR